MIEIVKKAAIKAGQKIMKIYNKDFNIEIKDDNSPITLADKEANKIILNELKTTGITILSEEERDNLERLDEEYLWIIDPVDGTKDFINKTGEFSIMIGLVKNGVPILGVVYVPAKDKLYFGEKGKGSFLEENGKIKKLQVDKNNKTVLISRNHTTDFERKFIKELDLESIPCGSIGVKWGLIAEGQAGIYINLSKYLKQWDSCAPEVILSEAGGKITDTIGNKIIYNTKNKNLENGCIGTNKIIHNNIIKKIGQN